MRALALAPLGLIAVLLAAAPARTAELLPGGLVLRAAGRAPIVGGRVDTAYRQALDEAFRRALLDALPALVPDRQSAADLERWQMTILARAPDFVGAWRILAFEQDDGFVRLEAEVGIWRGLLAAAARGVAFPGGPGVRVLVLAEFLPVPGPGSSDEVDAGRAAAAALGAEFARRGAVVLSPAIATTVLPSGPLATDAQRLAVAVTEGRRAGADAVVVLRLAPLGGGRLQFAVQLLVPRTEAVIATARTEASLPDGADPDAALAPPARSLAASLAPRLGAARAAERGRSGVP